MGYERGDLRGIQAGRGASIQSNRTHLRRGPAEHGLPLLAKGL